MNDAEKKALSDTIFKLSVKVLSLQGENEKLKAENQALKEKICADNN